MQLTAAEFLIVHEALMSYRNRNLDEPWATDELRRIAADDLLARMNADILAAAEARKKLAEVPPVAASPEPSDV